MLLPWRSKPKLIQLCIFLEQLCDYQIIKGGYYDDYELVRQIRSKKEALSYYEYGYKNFQQCWTSFKCPDDMYAYWRRVEFETESGYDYVTFYDANSDDYRKYSGRIGGSTSWYTMYVNEITFEFKADDSYNEYRGFEILLKCKSRDWYPPYQTTPWTKHSDDEN